jgi:hypothetical protein
MIRRSSSQSWLLLAALFWPSLALAESNFGSLAGRVLDPQGQPVAGAFVRWEYGCFSESVTSDAQGRYRFANVPYPDVDIIADSGALSHERISILLPGRGSEKSLDLPLKAGPNVVVKADGAKWRGILQSLKGSERWLRQVQQCEGGRLLFQASAGDYELSLFDPTQETWSCTQVRVTEQGLTIEPRLSEGLSFHGQVVDEKGKPVAAEILFETSLRLTERDFDDDGPLFRYFSEADGRFASRRLPKETRRVLVRALDSRLAIREQALKAGGELKITLEPWLPVKLSRADGWPDGEHLVIHGPYGVRGRYSKDNKDLIIEGLARGAPAEMRIWDNLRSLGLRLKIKGGDAPRPLPALQALGVVQGKLEIGGATAPFESELFFSNVMPDYAVRTYASRPLFGEPEVLGLNEETESTRSGASNWFEIAYIDKDGRYKISLLPGSWRVGLTPTGLHSITVKSGASLKLDLKP